MYGVGQKIGKHLGYATRIAQSMGRCQPGVDGDAALAGQGCQQVDRFAGDTSDIARGKIGRFARIIKTGKPQQRLNEVAHALGGALTGLQRFAILLGEIAAAQDILQMGE